MRLRRGLLVVLEGIDGSGKAVQGERLMRWLQSEGYSVRFYSYPDINSRFGEILNDFLGGRLRLDERTQLLAFAADIMKDQAAIRKALEAGDVVLLDRYVPSTIAYQCAKGVPLIDALKLMNMLQPLKPDVVLWFDVPPEVGIERRAKKKGKRRRDVHDADASLLRKVRANYLKLNNIKWLSRKWVRLDGNRPVKEIGEDIKSAVAQLLR